MVTVLNGILNFLRSGTLAPVAPQARSKTFTIEVPWVSLYSDFIPQILFTAMRAWRLAGPASGILILVLVTKWVTSTASPTAYMEGSEVSMVSSTAIAPVSPILSPASLASFTSGITPIARTAISASRILPLARLRATLPFALFLNSVTLSER